MKSERDYGRAYCKWCHKPFTKTHHRAVYCSTRCALNALREQKAKYQAKRRRLEKNGLLVLPEYKKYGLGSYGTSKSSHPKSDFTEEYEAIQKEMEFLKLRKNKRKLAEVLK